MDKYNPDQFEIIGLIAGNIKGLAGMQSKSGKDGPYIGGKLRYWTHSHSSVNFKIAA